MVPRAPITRVRCFSQLAWALGFGNKWTPANSGSRPPGPEEVIFCTRGFCIEFPQTPAVFLSDKYTYISVCASFRLLAPYNISLWWNLGSFLGVVIILQIARGICLTFYFEPFNAFNSLWGINYSLTSGSLLHFIHRNLPSLLFLFICIS